MINNRLDKLAEEYNVYVEAQAGFQAGMGTLDNILVLHGVIKHCRSEGKRLYSTFADFTNDQELIQSDPISCPQNQKGNNLIHKLTAVYERHVR